MSALNLGIPVLHDESLERGVYVLGDAIYMHPLTRIELTHPTDLHARLDDVMSWLVKQAEQRLDDVLGRL